MQNHTSRLLLLAAACSCLSAGPARAGTTVMPNPEPAVTTKDEGSIYDKIWSLATIYKSDTGFLNELSFQGRLQLQYATGDSDQGSFGSDDRPDELTWGDIEVRRWRLGMKSKWLNGKLKIEGQIDVNPNFERELGANPDLIGDGFYRQIYDLYAEYKVSDALNIGAGKRKTNFFGLEQSTSSKEILTFERGLISNTLFPGEFTGAWVYGKAGNVIWNVAGFAGDQAQEFSDFDTGALIQASIGYDLAEATKLDKAQVRFDYQAGTDASNSGGAGLFEHAFSLNSQWEKDRWGIYTDALGGLGRGAQGDVFGVIFMPTYYIANSLQVVFRYQYAHGSNDGLRVQSRYERLAPALTDGGRGEDYNAAYLGLNYYLYGHKLKLMTGVEYNNMDGGSDGGDFDGWTYLAGLRMFF